MMTLHTAKGLEFPVVFMCGMEDGLFPHQRSLHDLESIEEERRLCYVGTTRAMKHLYLSYAEQRRLNGMDTYGQASRFIQEMPEDLLEEVRPKIQYARPMRTDSYRPEARLKDPPASEGGIRLGARVRHLSFGQGIVLNIEGQGPHARIEVNFEGAGRKWLMLERAKLEAVR
jgi:DNA helicase II / ATP-dependent DNA helicase PcrA